MASHDTPTPGTGPGTDAVTGSRPERFLAPGHARLLEALLPVCEHHRLALAGVPALRVHGLVPAAPHPAEDLDLVTGESTPVAEIADDLARACRDAGCDAVPQFPGTALVAGLRVTPPYEHAAPPVAVTLAKRPLADPPLPAGAGLARPVPVVSPADAARLTLSAMTERTLPEDLLAAHALAARFGEGAMLAMACSFDEDFRPGLLAERLEKLAGLDDEAYRRCGAADGSLQGARRWALAWAQDIALDLMEGREHPDSYYSHSEAGLPAGFGDGRGSCSGDGSPPDPDGL
jgi:hypothetical protein